MQDDDLDAQQSADHALFADLRSVIEEELRAQIAMGWLGKIEPPAEGVDRLAGLIADMVFRVYRLERRDPRARAAVDPSAGD